ncbi:MAG: choice-of-anchor L domain-containing protein [Bacteroidetes bacterium]|nr:choice-of-anchor L domain-containing protein [Bacteroidota bacterium]
MRLLFSILIFSLIGTQVNAQIAVTANTNTTSAGAQLLVDFIAGSGVSITNAQFVGTPMASGTNSNNGTFTGGNMIGISSGLILSSGNVLQVVGPNTSGATSTNWYYDSNDPNLLSIATTSIHDGIGIEFDFTPESDMITFEYVFGSEEYNEYVGSGVNDIFGFFISGPGIAGTQNIALIPGTTVPVAIDNVNSGSYSSYYNNNDNGSTNIECDGFTDVFTAQKQVQACQTYHMKMIIADGGDNILDSWVFVLAGSFSAVGISDISVQYTNPMSGTDAIEGCNDGILVINLDAVTSANRTVPITMGGTATYGVDYTITANPPATVTGTYPNLVVTIPTGSSQGLLNIVPIADGLVEATENITMNIQTNFCPPFEYLNGAINILDQPAVLNMSLLDTVTICPGEAASLTPTVSGGLGTISYAWSPATGLSSSTVASPTATPATTTNYTLTASDVCGQSVTDNIVVDVQTNAVVSITIAVNPAGPYCPGDPITFTANPSNGGTAPTYQWKLNGSNVGTNSTTYSTTAQNNGDQITCVLTSNSGCASGNPATSNIITISMGVGPTASITANGPTNICQGSSVELAANTGSGYTYQWYLNGTAIAGATNDTYFATANGNYTVQVSTNCGVNMSAPVAVTVIPIATAFISAGGPTSVCQGNSVTLTAQTGSAYTFQWYKDGAIIAGATSASYTANQSGSYYCQVSNSCGPVNSNTISVTIVTPPVANAGIDQTICPGNYTTISASGGVTYSWSPTATLNNPISGSTAAMPTATTTYTVTVTDAYGCTGTDDITITVTAGVFPSAGQNVAICQGSSTQLGAVGGSIYVWSPPTGLSDPLIQNPVASPNITTTYTVNISDAGGCSGTASVIVTVNTPPTASFVTNSPVCINTPCLISFNGIAGPTATFLWSFGTGTINSGSGQGPYSVSWSTAGMQSVSLVISENGCQSTTYLQQVEIKPEPVLAILPSITEGCEPLTVVFTDNSSPASTAWSWYFGDPFSMTDVSTDAAPTYMYESDGVYSVSLTVTASNGCSKGQTFQDLISVWKNPEAEFIIGNDEPTTIDPVVDFFDQSSDIVTAWFWDFGDSLSDIGYSNVQNPDHKYTLEGIYTIWLYAETEHQCIDSVSHTVEVDEVFRLYVPNSFTPDHDGINDKFGPKGIYASTEEYEMTIYDRWGEPVYFTKDIENHWDGTLIDGVEAPQGAYVYHIRVKDLHKKYHQFQGAIFLMR